MTKRVISFILTLTMLLAIVPPIELGASTLNVIPEVVNLDMDSYKAAYNGQTVRYMYAYAYDDIYSDYDCTITWDDVCDYYYVAVKFLEGDPDPGGDTSDEPGNAPSKYIHKKEEEYDKNYITISQSDLEQYSGQYMKLCVIGYDYNGDGTHRTDSYIYIDDGLEFDFSDFTYSTTIKLGEDITWSGKVDVDYVDLDAVSVSIKKPDGTAIYYREEDIGDDAFYTEDIEDGCIPTNDIAPVGYMPKEGGGWDKVKDFIIDEPGTYDMYVTASIENGQYTRFGPLKITVLPEEEPKVSKVTVSSSTVTVSESFTITATANSSAEGVALYADKLDWHIGDIIFESGENSGTCTYAFAKTNTPGLVDETNIRTILAYPIKNGEPVIDLSKSAQCSITVNPTEYEFPSLIVNDSTTEIGKSVTITWEPLSTHDGRTVYYKVEIGGIIFAEKLTKAEYTLSAADVESLGVGDYSIMVYATASGYRMRQGIGVGKDFPTLIINANAGVIVKPGDVNGDGKINGLDVTRLREYLANCEDDIAAYSLSEGADVNGDGKVNGKDLSKLLKNLDKNGETIPKEPDPVVPTPPEVQHTYTVTIPLDKADLKATTGRTIYLIPLGGYFALRAYDENGKAYKLGDAGLWYSHDHKMLQFYGDTLCAIKSGYSVFTVFKEDENGDLVELESFEIHVGRSKLPVEKWKSVYQYEQEEYEYVSVCLDICLSLNKANIPNYEELEMDWIDGVLEGMGDWKDRLSNILLNEWNFETQIIKESIALFVDDYAKKMEAIINQNSEDAKKDAENVVDLLEQIYTYSDEIDKSIGGVADLLESIKDIRANQVTMQKIAELQKQVEWMYENGNLKEMFNSSPRLKAYQASKEISLHNFTEKLAKTNTISGRLDIDVIGVGLDFLKGIVYVTNDYDNNIKVLEMLKKQIIPYCDADSPELEAICELIDEYNNKAITAMDDFLASLVINGFEATFLKHPLFAIFDLATLIVNEINHTEEKVNLRNLIFYHTALLGVLHDAPHEMYNYGTIKSDLDSIKFSINIYLYMLIFENEIAMNVVYKENIDKVKDEIDEIKEIFADYLNYSFLATTSLTGN